jgi:glutamate/tyrosine decarboxylase-like PLP-dependent enzyme
MIERIRELEAVARRLEPGRETRAPVRDAVVAYGENFLDRLPQLKAYEIDKTAAKEIRESPIVDEGSSVNDLLALFEEAVVAPGLNPASGGHIAYIPGGGIYFSSLGDYLAAVTNRYAGVRFAGPGAVEMENMLLDWMADVIGYPEGAGGNLASGGSIANLIGIVTARDAYGLKARDFERAVVYVTRQVHHCVDKALRVAGVGECVRRYVSLDERYRMIPAELERAIAKDRGAGLIPWLVIASAGTTDVGAVDPLQEIGRIAESEGLWYHVDAAYGGFFALVDECRPKLAGMELSDSIVLDPHKGLFLPYGTGALLVKDVRALHRSHYYQAAYMQDTVAEESLELSSPAELSPELTKHFRGLRMWLPLKLHGVGPFRACLEEKLLLTRYFYEEVQKLGFEVGPEPELSVATYRWVPEVGDADEFNRALVDEIHRDGRVFISSTMLEGCFVLRLAVLTFRTHLETIDLLLDVLREKVAVLTAGH